MKEFYLQVVSYVHKMMTTHLGPGAAAIVIMMKKKSSAEKVMGLIREINIIYSLLSYFLSIVF